MGVRTFELNQVRTAIQNTSSGPERLVVISQGNVVEDGIRTSASVTFDAETPVPLVNTNAALSDKDRVDIGRLCEQIYQSRFTGCELEDSGTLLVPAVEIPLT